jgi:PAS domain S-box-containing protein
MQIRTASGFAGLAVEMVSQAAERAGVQLRWVETGTSSDEAFEKGLVDLWPLMADLPERRKRIHFTRPWLHSNFSLLLHADSLSLDRNFTGLIAVFRMPLNVSLLREQFPHAQVDEFSEAKDVVKAVCRGRAAAGFLEGRVALTALHDKPSECASVALRVQTLPDLSVQSSVASTFEAAGGADIIRREIGNMYRDGTLAAAMAKYSYYGLDNTWTSFDLMEAAERTRRRAWGIGALAMGVALALWLASFLHQRQRAGVMLRESEERFRATFFQAAVGIAQTSLQGEWLLLNNRFSEIVGYTQAELSGKTFVDITHPDDREANNVARRQFLAGEISSWSVEKRYIHKNGAIVWAKVHVSLVRDQHRVPQYFISVVEDITDRIQAEHALRETERRLALAQSAAHLGAWDWDLLTDAHLVSGEYLLLYGLPPDHPPITYQKWLELVHPEDRERVQTLVREAIEQTRVWDAEFRVLWSDGSVHWLLGKGTVLQDHTGRPVRMAGVNVDITARRQAEAELRAQELQYKEVFDNISVCMFLLDVTLDGRFKIASFNPAEERATGLSNAVVSERLVEEVLGEELARKVIANYSRCLQAGATIAYDDELDLPAGRRSFHSNLIPIRDHTGRIHRIVGVCVDMTDQKQAEAFVRRNLEEIAHLNRVGAMGELTASLAHELNQPLAAILSNAQAASRFLNGKCPDLPQIRECLADIVADDKRAGDVIKRVRALLKKEESEATKVDLNEVVGDAIRLVGNDAMLRNVSVQFEPLPGLPPVLGDRIQLYQVILNLIVNGLDAAAERPRGDRWMSVRTMEADGGGVELAVEDSGEGIADSDMARVFEPFFTTKREGLGMGLSISRSIVKAHGGRIWAQRNAEGGAIFRCWLPVAQQAAASSAI